MKVTLAGYNVDSSLLAKLNDPAATPETLSAAYARISRSPKSVTELRGEALAEVAGARRSNQKIIFEMGHASVAEHAVFNFDLVGISRLLTDTVQSVRLASFTEKSQRYVTFENDYVVPAELEQPAHAALKAEYLALMEDLFAEYKASYAGLKRLCAKQFPGLGQRELEGRAKEDARYILPLATKTQMGMTINARSLENLIRKLNRSPLSEAEELAAQLELPLASLCPSLIRHTGPDGYSGDFKYKGPLTKTDDFGDDEHARLIFATPDADNVILAGLLFRQSQAAFQDCLQVVQLSSAEARRGLWQQVFHGLQAWHKLPRTFELADFTFELQMSESCWAQFKRHRVGTLLKQVRPLADRFILPEGITMIKRHNQWDRLIDRRDALSQKLAGLSPDLSPYALLNGNKVKVVAKMNLRELYHLIRLRCDEHAQWEIQQVAYSIADHLRVICPYATSYLCGKSEFQNP